MTAETARTNPAEPAEAGDRQTSDTAATGPTLYAVPDEPSPDPAPETDDSTETADDGPGTTSGSADVTVGGRVDWPKVIAWAREAVTPQSGLYTDRPPAVDEIVARAKRGAHLPETGPLRTAARIDGYVVAANKVAVRTWEFVVDHPARRITVAALLALAVLYPPTRAVLAFLLWPLAWAQQALS